MISTLLLSSLFDATIFLRKHTKIKQLLSATTGYQAQILLNLLGIQCCVPPVKPQPSDTGDLEVVKHVLHLHVAVPANVYDVDMVTPTLRQRIVVVAIPASCSGLWNRKEREPKLSFF